MITVTDVDSKLVWESPESTVEEACAEATLAFAVLEPSATNFFLCVEHNGEKQYLEARIEVRRCVTFHEVSEEDL